MKNIIETLDNLIWKKVNHPEILNMEVSEYGHFRRIGSEIIRMGTIDNNGFDKDNFRWWENIRLEPIPQGQGR